MRLNTPSAILIGLTLIAGALFFRQPVISEAQASDCATRSDLEQAVSQIKRHFLVWCD